MTLRTSIRLPIVATALAAVLVIVPNASASFDPGSHRNAPVVVDPHGTQAGITPSVPSVPDRTDLLGTSRGPQVVQVPLATTNDGGLSWTNAAIGAAFLLAASLLAAYAFMSATGRRRGGLPTPS
jgi:hypothetical protein